MPPKPFERFFKKNLDDDKVFDEEVSKEVSKIIDRVGVNSAGLHLAYIQAKELNAKRKEPHHKNYLLNLVRDTAVSSDRFIIDSGLDMELGKNVDAEIARMRAEN